MPPRSLRHRPGYIFVVPLRGDALAGRWAHAVKDDEVGSSAPTLCGRAPAAGAVWVRRMPLGATRCHGCVSLFNQLIGMVGGRMSSSAIKEHRTPRQVMADVRKTWKTTNRPIIEQALHVLENIDSLDESFEGMSGMKALEEFNDRCWRVWRGKHTHALKQELDSMYKNAVRKKKRAAR